MLSRLAQKERSSPEEQPNSPLPHPHAEEGTQHRLEDHQAQHLRPPEAERLQNGKFPCAVADRHREAVAHADEDDAKRHATQPSAKLDDARHARNCRTLVEKVKAAFFMVQAEQQLISRLKLIQELD